MPVLQLVEHIAAQVKEGIAAHVVAHLGTENGTHRVPIDLFVAEETIMLIDNAPQRIEVAHGIVGHILVVIDEARVQ